MSLVTLRKVLAKPEASWQLCLLGSIGGALASIIIIIFRLCIESLQLLYLDKIDDYTTLSEFSRFLTPLISVTAILFIAWIAGFKYSRLGIPFVIHRLKVAYGSIPYQNTLTQFFGGIFALAGGFSVGREGPAVHIGAASSSYIGSKLLLPRNAIRTLCACGIAAGISASFNTPLAAVIFVMEVILREYKIHLFVPVILASIIGSIMTNAVFGSYHDFDVFAYIQIDIWHYPFLILFGIGLGILSKGFNSSLMWVIKVAEKIHMVLRLILAALVMGIIGVLVPESMGSSLGTLNVLIQQNPEMTILFGLLVAKFIATVCVLGLGVPGGIIGPTLTLGAIAGAIMGFLVSFAFVDIHFMGDYALLGMAGMFAANLSAPLAGLLAVIELSNQLELALPAMVVITSAFITSRQFLNNRSIFLQQLEFQKLPYKTSHLEGSLQKYGIIGKMNHRIKVIEHSDYKTISAEFSKLELKYDLILKPNAEQNYYKHVQVDFNSHPLENSSQSLVFNKMTYLDSQATLSDAYQQLFEARKGSIYIYDSNIDDIIGLITFEQIRAILIKGYT